MGRLVGVDLARALAVFGMYVVHLGPSATNASGIGAWVRHLTEGRSSALFATLAGFSLMLIAGRLEPKTGVAGRQAKARIAIRAVVLLVLGTVMITFYGDVVILASYGLFFLLAMPLLRLSARTLAIIAAGVAVVGPLLAFGLKSLITEPVTAAVKVYDPLAQLGGAGLLDLVLTGFYPAIPWMAFIIAGMALGRLDVSSGTVRKRLAVFGPALAVFAYGTSWLLAQLIDGVGEAAEMQSARGPGSGMEPKDLGSAGDMAQPDAIGGMTPPGTTGSAWSLLTSGPHSGMPFDVIGCIGVAITVIVLAMMAIDRLPLLQRLAAPIIAVGTISLTALNSSVLPEVGMALSELTMAGLYGRQVSIVRRMLSKVEMLHRSAGCSERPSASAARMAEAMRSPVMLPLVSIKTPTLIGAGSSEKTATSCGAPSS